MISAAYRTQQNKLNKCQLADEHFYVFEIWELLAYIWRWRDKFLISCEVLILFCCNAIGIQFRKQ